MSSPQTVSFPGAAIKSITNENQYLENFVSMIKKKLLLENKYIADLKLLRESWDPRWIESGLSPLISPILDYINSEIEYKANACAEISSRLEGISSVIPPGLHDEGDFKLFKMPAMLELPCKAYEKCRKSIISTKAENSPTKPQLGQVEENIQDPAGVILSPKNRDFRKAAKWQNRAVKEAGRWYTQYLPGIIDRHQQCSEDIKMFLLGVFNSLSKLQTNLSTACSVALNSTTLFASSHSISPRYEEAEKEAEHHLLQKRGYYNYVDDVEISRPIFGLGPEATVALVNRLWDANYQDLALGGWSLLDIRTHASMFERAGMAVRHVGDLERKYILAYAFYSDAPLIPIPKEEIAMYRSTSLDLRT